MSEPASVARQTYAAYLAAEQVAEVKHEYLRGETFAMAGGTPEHARLAGRMIYLLNSALEGRPCAVFSSDARVRVVATDIATYPDVTVVCGRLEHPPDDSDALSNPVVIVEVLSDSTEAYDRGQKFAHYRRISSLRDYVLVGQREPRLEMFTRDDEGRWRLSEAGPGEVLVLASLDVRLAVDAVFRSSLPA